jgi:integron integrase
VFEHGKIHKLFSILNIIRVARMESKPKFKPDSGLKLMEQVRQVLRYYHYAYRTEQSYCDWIIRFIRFHGSERHPKDMGKSEVEGFLSHLASEGKVSASTQRQALNAIVFLYRDVLDQPIQGEIAPVRAKRHPRVPVVMTQGEVQRVLREMHGTHLLMAKLLYGGGLRLMECVRLRVQDLDFERGLVYVRAAKGGKDRTTLFAKAIRGELKLHLDKVRRLHDQDLGEGHGEVYMPESLAGKYRGAAKEFRWQYVFPSKSLGTDPRTGMTRRHHVLESGLQKAVKIAVDRAGIQKRVSCHTFRHCFATHLLEKGVNICVVQELMGHADVKTTEIYTHVMQKDVLAVVSPLDHLERRG